MQSIAYPLAIGPVVTRVIEAGSGPAVLFVHGLGARADRFRGTVERIAGAGFRAVAFDLPGHGFSNKPAEGPFDVPGIVTFLSALMDRLEIGKAVLVGTSLGAHICAYAACRDPARVPALALIGALGIVPLAQETAEAIRRNVRAAAIDQIAGKLRFVFADPSLITPALIQEEWRINNAPGALDYFTRIGDYLVDGIARDYVAEKLKSLYTPDQLMLVWGAEDKAVPLSVGEACRDALGAELHLIPNAGHAPYLEQPAAFDPLLLPFLYKWTT